MEKKSTRQVNTQNNSCMLDRAPIIMRAVSGFSSCLTVSVTSVIFIWSIHRAVTSGISSWPGLITAIIMLAGPIIITLNFVNAKGIITTILPPQSSTGEEGIDSSQPVTLVIPKASPIMTPEDIAFERELMGHTSVLLRAVAGFISTHVICFCSLLFTITIHDSMVTGKPLPTNGELLLVVIGPVVTSWNFVRAGATLSAVMNGASNIDKYREKLSAIIKPKG